MHFLEAIAAVLVGGGLTLLGVWAQLWHDSRQRERERLMSLRKEVYLEVAEAQAAHLNYIVGLGRLDKSLDTLTEPLRKREGWLNKLHVVASQDTIQTMLGLGEFFDSATSDLAGRRMKYEQLKGESDAIERAKAQLVELGNQAAAATPVGFGAKPSNTTEDAKRREDMWQALHTRQQVLVAALRPMIREILVDSIKYAQQYPALLAKANIGVRKEIGMPLDEEKYLASVKESVEKAGAHFEALMQRYDEVTGRNDKA